MDDREIMDLFKDAYFNENLESAKTLLDIIENKKNNGVEVLLAERNRNIQIPHAKNDYGDLWNILENDSQNDIVRAYVDFEKRHNTRIPISDINETLTKVVEIEIKDKLFKRFIPVVVDKSPISIYPLDKDSKTTKDMNRAIKDYKEHSRIIITLGTMMYLIMGSQNNNRKKYAKLLYDYFMNDKWDMTTLSSIDTMRCMRYINSRNLSHHERNDDPELFNKCKYDTKEIMKWFLKSYSTSKSFKSSENR